jgi:hypothetical protein
VNYNLFLFVLIVSSWLFQLPARAELVYTADGQTLYGHVRSGTAPGTLLIDGDEAPVTVRREEIAAIDFGAPAAPAGQARSATVRLRNGDRLVGALRQLWPPVIAGAGGTRVVPPSWVAALQLHGKGSVGDQAAGGTDAIELANGDRVEGRIEGTRGGMLRVRTSLGVLSINPARVRQVVTAVGEAPAEGTSGLQATLETTDGERLTGEWLGLTATELRLKPAWGAEITLPVERASRLTVLNGRLVFVSDLRPAEVSEIPYFDTPRPFRIDRSQGGRPLRLGGRVYARGLGVHARSALTYALAGHFKTFAATLGIDSEVGNGGSVIFRVVGDERPLFESPVLRGGDAPLPLTVDVSGVQLLRLEVEQAAPRGADVADHADWAEARLLK